MEADDEDDDDEDEIDEDDDQDGADPDPLAEAGAAAAVVVAAVDASAGFESDDENTEEMDETSEENDQPPPDDAGAGGGGGGADASDPTEAFSYADEKEADEPERVRPLRLPAATSDESARRARDGSVPPLCESGNKDEPDPTPDMEPGREPEPDADKDGGGGALPPNANETRRLPVAAPLRNAASSSSNAPTAVSAKLAPARLACAVPAAVALGTSEKNENSLSKRGS